MEADGSIVTIERWPTEAVSRLEDIEDKVAVARVVQVDLQVEIWTTPPGLQRAAAMAELLQTQMEVCTFCARVRPACLKMRKLTGSASMANRAKLQALSFVAMRVPRHSNHKNIGQFLWRPHLLQCRIIRQTIPIRWIGFSTDQWGQVVPGGVSDSEAIGPDEFSRQHLFLVGNS